MQVADIGIIQHVADVFLEDELFNGGFAVVLGIKRVGDNVTGVSGGAIGVTGTGSHVAGRLVDGYAGNSVLAALALFAGLAVRAVTGQAVVVLTGLDTIGLPAGRSLL